MLAPDPDDEMPGRPRPPNLASPRSRLAAASLDVTLIGVALYWTGTVGQDLAFAGAGPRLLVLSHLLVWAAVLVFPVILEGNTGQTPGKALLGIRVVDLETGGPIGWRRAAHRSAPRSLFWCVSFLAMTDPLAQTLQDRSAGTIVIRVPPGPPRSGWPEQVRARKNH